MAVYSSKYATRGVTPRIRRRQFSTLRRAAAAVGVFLLLIATGLGLWRATFGVPDPPLPGLVSVAE